MCVYGSLNASNWCETIGHKGQYVKVPEPGAPAYCVTICVCVIARKYHGRVAHEQDKRLGNQVSKQIET